LLTPSNLRSYDAADGVHLALTKASLAGLGLWVGPTGGPIQGITEKGVRTKDAELSLGAIVFATGVDAAYGRADGPSSNAIQRRKQWRAQSAILD